MYIRNIETTIITDIKKKNSVFFLYIFTKFCNVRCVAIVCVCANNIRIYMHTRSHAIIQRCVRDKIKSYLFYYYIRTYISCISNTCKI